MTQQELDRIWEDVGKVSLRHITYEWDEEWFAAIQRWEKKVEELGGRFRSLSRSRWDDIDELIYILEPLGISILVNSPYKYREDALYIIFFKKEE
jgi:hypothetical protein